MTDNVSLLKCPQCRPARALTASLGSGPFAAWWVCGRCKMRYVPTEATPLDPVLSATTKSGQPCVCGPVLMLQALLQQCVTSGDTAIECGGQLVFDVKKEAVAKVLISEDLSTFWIRTEEGDLVGAVRLVGFGTEDDNDQTIPVVCTTMVALQDELEQEAADKTGVLRFAGASPPAPGGDDDDDDQEVEVEDAGASPPAPDDDVDDDDTGASSPVPGDDDDDDQEVEVDDAGATPRAPDDDVDQKEMEPTVVVSVQHPTFVVAPGRSLFEQVERAFPCEFSATFEAFRIRVRQHFCRSG